MPRARSPRVAAVALAVALAGGCGGQPAAIPTIGSPSPTPSLTGLPSDRSAELAEKWDLTGADLPADWPDVPVPEGTEVITAYAVGAEPRRTWTATFAADRGTALDLAEPVVAELRERGYVPISEYTGAASTNTGLFSFAAPTFAVYVVLGEDNGRPNLVMTIRGSTDESAGLPPGATTPPGAAPPASEDATDEPSTSESPSGSPSASDTGAPSRAAPSADGSD